MEWLKENHPDPVTDQAAHRHNCNDLVNQGNNGDLTDNQICDGDLQYNLKRKHFSNEGVKKGMIYLTMSI